ncbi:uncharacterized protein LACBIDRAFT_296913 [Laccaria bicolor S238N-H82]|uniref:Predicted protein n=1 Tax=Laccaria bicolor (strain S238N-H82 / ATCC MYA-4686) TaxID=486041 RepID=B0D9J7_LACBS|nr:uncharacterized protein LACBIDRAFT_296913 [Laccaria bicolor S238N-H82]EDR08364.1 predicted protein [Laccaria bicolor S238N-H82]|eukprot:XP_001880589.1 predicted protein [Laccaria bicolor S238N-H82]
MPRGVNCNRNRSAFSPEVNRPDQTRPQKDRRLWSFAVCRLVSVCIGFNRFMTGL